MINIPSKQQAALSRKLLTLELENRQAGVDLNLLRAKKRLKGGGGTKTLSTFPILEEAAITALMETASAYRSTLPSAAGTKNPYDAKSIGSRYES